ncbi:MAG: DUF5343 domain-containing protein [bacterium]|nr:DUF5343 domain-containing protein [bacterium]
MSFFYVTLTGEIKKLFYKIQEVGKPTIVDKTWIKQCGFKDDQNHMRFITLLQTLGFIDQSNKPTELWTAYRDKIQARAVMANIIKDTYNEFFEHFSDAQIKVNKDLISIVTAQKDKFNESTATRVVRTFKALCNLADFESQPEKREEIVEIESETVSQGVAVQDIHTNIPSISINIQIELPESADTKMFQELFKAMREYLYDKE